MRSTFRKLIINSDRWTQIVGLWFLWCLFFYVMYRKNGSKPCVTDRDQVRGGGTRTAHSALRTVPQSIKKLLLNFCFVKLCTSVFLLVCWFCVIIRTITNLLFTDKQFGFKWKYWTLSPTYNIIFVITNTKIDDSLEDYSFMCHLKNKKR